MIEESGDLGNKASNKAVVSRLLEVYGCFQEISFCSIVSDYYVLLWKKTEAIDYHGLIAWTISNLRCGINLSGSWHCGLFGLETVPSPSLAALSQVASQSLCHLESYLSRILLSWQAPFFPSFYYACLIYLPEICIANLIRLLTIFELPQTLSPHNIRSPDESPAFRNQPANTISRINKEPRFTFQFASLFVRHLEIITKTLDVADVKAMSKAYNISAANKSNRNA